MKNHKLINILVSGILVLLSQQARSMEDLKNICDYRVRYEKSEFPVPSYIKDILKSPKEYIELQLNQINQYASGQALINFLGEALKGKKLIITFSDCQDTSGDVVNGDALLSINLNKTIIELNDKTSKFPEVFSILPLVQSQFNISQDPNRPLWVIQIMPDRSPFWLTIAHELIHVYHKLKDQNEYRTVHNKDPEEVIAQIGSGDIAGKDFPEFTNASRLSPQKLWTNLEERNTVLNKNDISELKLRLEAGEKIRYIYQPSNLIFLELKSTFDKIVGMEIEFPIKKVYYHKI